MNTETLAFEDIRVGDELPGLDVKITPKLVVGGALATRDFTRVHHDRAYAQAQGLPDVIMNTHTTKGLIGRFATDWAGPGAFVQRMTLRLGTPNSPGDTLKLRGKVLEKDEGQRQVVVEYAGSNSWGDHATGQLTLVLSEGGAS